ncbi:class I SAM-dependent methyltransferase [Pelomicrobium methylotrophicum]|uniref:Class I SAM-dependent methyltransferase n=1 Tax=Pelomicrobium methylotrophicum TaxID=2602750 RepID=A0A5C7F1R8_9PROT|nr:class I SAM-dependent methyltransferase [Pelomicrobium methylotrophicum]TXF13728.1 class I SAM-dependent methyltransferase [Pelomicrobium methylotrophicum]
MTLPRWLSRYFGLPADDGSVSGQEGADSLFRRDGDERLLLHIGCGQADIRSLPSGFQSGWREIRVDLDPAARPHLLASFADLTLVPDGSVDAVFSSHTIEHLYWFEVPQALAECRRVLRPDGMLVTTCPDLQAAAEMIAADRIDEVAYISPAGPVTPFDIVFSYRPFVERAPQTMSHKCGFTVRTLSTAMREAGFPAVFAFRRPAHFDLWCLARPIPTPPEELERLAAAYLAPRA